MQVIPVIDLKAGIVVHARMGQRDRYRPIETPLSATSDPVDVTRGLMSLYPFKTLYVADLDAIERNGDNRAALARVKAAFPGLTLWVDNGIGSLNAAADFIETELGHLVLGSETQTGLDVVRHFSNDPRAVLSLDFRTDAFQGPPALLVDPTCWPRRVIAMTLARVGSGAGPDLERLRTIRDAAAKDTATSRQVYAAGGIRDAADLATLQQLGIAGALVASCLHDGRLRGEEIAKLHMRP
ncbi:MAG: nickel transporter [Xanthobacteraceae bacterium]|nr:nickel transporter [Xanthobacteraceae bacterium]